jgi:type IV fimbrial biogenesis protein FimT
MMMFKPSDSNGRKKMNRTSIIKGFSFIEVLTVIAILGIVSSMAAYSWQRYVANNNLRTAARDLAADIALYRQKAVGENNNYTISFDMGNNSYTITNVATGVSNSPKSPSDIVKDPDVKLNSVAFFPGGVIITIQSRGLVGNGTITMTNSRGSQATITVSSAGRTDLQFNMQ